MARRVNMHLDEGLVAEIERHKPRSLALSAFCALLIEQQLVGLDCSATIPAYRVGAGEGHTGIPGTWGALAQQPTSNGGLHPEHSEDVDCLVSKLSSPQVSVGEGVGRGVQGGTPRKGVSASRAVVESLLQHEELIREFWRVKGGSKGDVAWKLLMTELSKMQKLYGDAVVAEQLQLAINGKWQGVSVRLYEQFKAPKGQPPAQPETRHPASRVFTAERGFEDEPPVTNPILKGLF